MKLTHFISLLIASTCLAGTDTDKKIGAADSVTTASVTADENAAIATFKGAVESMTKWIEEKQKTAAADPTAGIAMIGELVAKFKDIKADGLPEDLKTAWGNMVGVVKELGDIFKGLPKLDPAKPDEMMKALSAIAPKMMAMQPKLEPIVKKLEEVGKKYGLDLKKLGPGGK